MKLKLEGKKPNSHEKDRALKTLHFNSFVISLPGQGISLPKCFHNVLILEWDPWML